MVRWDKLLAAGALSLSGLSADAVLLDRVDFEAETPGLIAEPFSPVGTPEVTFTSTLPLVIATVGAPTEGFVPDDIPAGPGMPLGTQFLTTGGATTSDLTVTYSAPVGLLQFDLVDVDGRLADAEIFTTSFFDSATKPLGTVITIAGDPGTGDGELTRVSFNAGANIVKSFTISGSTAGFVREIGIAFDNFDTRRCCVPDPGALPMLGLCALGAFWRRRTFARNGSETSFDS